MTTSNTDFFNTDLNEESVRLIVDNAVMVNFPVVPYDLSNWRILFSHHKHPLWFTAFCEELPAKTTLIMQIDFVKL